MPRNIGGEELGQAGVAPTHLIGGVCLKLYGGLLPKRQETRDPYLFRCLRPCSRVIIQCRGPEAALLDRFKLLLVFVSGY